MVDPEFDDGMKAAQEHLDRTDPSNDETNTIEDVIFGYEAGKEKALAMPEGTLEEKMEKLRVIAKVIKLFKNSRRKIDKQTQEELSKKVQNHIRELRDVDTRLNSEVTAETKRLSKVNQIRLKYQGRLTDVLELEDPKDQVAGLKRLMKDIREKPGKEDTQEIRAVDLSDQLREVKQHHAEVCLAIIKDLYENKEGKEDKYLEALERLLENLDNDEDVAEYIQEVNEIAEGIRRLFAEREEAKKQAVRKAAQPRIRLREELVELTSGNGGSKEQMEKLRQLIPHIIKAAFNEDGELDHDVIEEMKVARPNDEEQNPVMVGIIDRLMQVVVAFPREALEDLTLEELLNDDILEKTLADLKPAEVEDEDESDAVDDEADDFFGGADDDGDEEGDAFDDEETAMGLTAQEQAGIYLQRLARLDDTQDLGEAYPKAQTLCIEVERAIVNDAEFAAQYGEDVLRAVQEKRDQFMQEINEHYPDLADALADINSIGIHDSDQDILNKTGQFQQDWLKAMAEQRRLDSQGSDDHASAEQVFQNRKSNALMIKVAGFLILAGAAAFGISHWKPQESTDLPTPSVPVPPTPEPTPKPIPAEISADFLARYLQEVQDANSAVELDRITTHAQARHAEGKLNQADLTRLLELIETKRAVILAAEAQQRRQELSEQINNLEAELESEAELLRLRELLRERFTNEEVIATLEAIIVQKLEVIERLKNQAAQERARTLIDGLTIELRAIQSGDGEAEEKIRELIQRAQRSAEGDRVDAQAIRDRLAGFQQAAEAHLQSILQERQERNTGSQQALERANRYRDELNAVQLQEGINFTEVIDAIKARIEADNPSNEHERATFETLRAGLLTFANERHEQLRVQAADAAAAQARLEAERQAQAAQIAEAAQRHREYMEQIRDFTAADFPTRMTEFWQQVRAYRRSNPHFTPHYTEVRDALQARVHEFRRAALERRVDAVLSTHRESPQGLTSLQALAQLRTSISAETGSIERAMAPDLLRQIFELEISIAAALPLGRDPQTQLANIRRAVDAAGLSGEVQLNLDHQIETAAVRRSREERDWWLQRERSYPGRTAGITSATRLHESALDRLFELNIERRARQIVGRLTSAQRPAALQLHQRRLTDFQAQLTATGQSSTDTARRYIDEELYDENRTDEERRTAEALLQSGQSERERLESLIRVERRVIGLLRGVR